MAPSMSQLVVSQQLTDTQVSAVTRDDTGPSPKSSKMAQAQIVAGASGKDSRFGLLGGGGNPSKKMCPLAKMLVTLNYIFMVINMLVS